MNPELSNRNFVLKNVIKQLKQFRMCIFFHLMHAFRHKKNNLAEIHIIPIQTDATNMYGMHDIFIDRDTHTDIWQSYAVR